MPANTPATTAIQDLESDTFDTPALRTWLQSRTQPSGVPQTNNTTPVPTFSVIPTPGAVIAVTPTATERVAPAMTITGKTTFQELMGWGVPKENIQKVIGTDLPALSTVIKDYVTGKGMEFTEIKTQLQAEVDKAK